VERARHVGSLILDLRVLQARKEAPEHEPFLMAEINW